MFTQIIKGAISDCCNSSVCECVSKGILHPEPSYKIVCSKCNQGCTWKTAEQVEREYNDKQAIERHRLRKEREQNRQRFEMIKAMASGWNANERINYTFDAQTIVRFADEILKIMEETKK